MPLRDTPLKMYFLKEKKMMSKGTVTIVEAASCRFKTEFGPVVSEAPRNPAIKPLLTRSCSV